MRSTQPIKESSSSKFCFSCNKCRYFSVHASVSCVKIKLTIMSSSVYILAQHVTSVALLPDFALFPYDVPVNIAAYPKFLVDIRFYFYNTVHFADGVVTLNVNGCIFLGELVPRKCVLGV